MRTVYELRVDELDELRGTYYQQLLDTDPSVIEGFNSYLDVPLDVILLHYEGIMFVEDDFFCNQ